MSDQRQERGRFDLIEAFARIPQTFGLNIQVQDGGLHALLVEHPPGWQPGDVFDGDDEDGWRNPRHPEDRYRDRTIFSINAASPEAFERLLLAAIRERFPDAHPIRWSEGGTVVLPPGAIEWLRDGDRGSSSEAIFSHLTGIPVDGGECSAPLDPADLTRCRRLLEAVPAFRAEFRRMAELGEHWKLLVEGWDDLCTLMDDEAPNWRDRYYNWSAPMTFMRMNNLSDEAHARERIIKAVLAPNRGSPQ